VEHATQLLILSQLERSLDAHVLKQNRADRSTYYRNIKMREVQGLADVVSSTVKRLKAAHLAATTRFKTEVANSETNLTKVSAFTDELATANKEMEAALGDTGSNFPTSEAAGSPKPDINGVTVNHPE
jgi:hypothetical protein